MKTNEWIKVKEMMSNKNIFVLALTDKEIISQLITFLLAGYETTSSTFSFLAHSLAMNQDIQDKVHDEIMTVIGEVSFKYYKM